MSNKEKAHALDDIIARALAVAATSKRPPDPVTPAVQYANEALDAFKVHVDKVLPDEDIAARKTPNLGDSEWEFLFTDMGKARVAANGQFYSLRRLANASLVRKKEGCMRGLRTRGSSPLAEIFMAENRSSGHLTTLVDALECSCVLARLDFRRFA
jgi:hypothetical protein